MFVNIISKFSRLIRLKLCMKAQRPGSQIVPDEKYHCCNQEQEGGAMTFSAFYDGRHFVFHDCSFPKNLANTADRAAEEFCTVLMKSV